MVKIKMDFFGIIGLLYIVAGIAMITVGSIIFSSGLLELIYQISYLLLGVIYFWACFTLPKKMSQEATGIYGYYAFIISKVLSVSMVYSWIFIGIALSISKKYLTLTTYYEITPIIIWGTLITGFLLNCLSGIIVFLNCKDYQRRCRYVQG